MIMIHVQFHFLMQCSRYTEFREVLYNKSSNLIDNFYSYNDNEKFVLLCKYAHKYVSQFIENAYNKRKRTLYNWLRLNDEKPTPTDWLFDMAYMYM